MTAPLRIVPQPTDDNQSGEPLGIVLHSWRDDDRRCTRCHEAYDSYLLSVHIIVGRPSPAISTALCTKCVETERGDEGRALVRVRDGLQEFDDALNWCPDDRLRDMAAIFKSGAAMIAGTHRIAEQARYVEVHGGAL